MRLSVALQLLWDIPNSLTWSDLDWPLHLSRGWRFSLGRKHWWNLGICNLNFCPSLTMYCDYLTASNVNQLSSESEQIYNFLWIHSVSDLKLEFSPTNYPKLKSCIGTMDRVTNTPLQAEIAPTFEEGQTSALSEIPYMGFPLQLCCSWEKCWSHQPLKALSYSDSWQLGPLLWDEFANGVL